MKGMYSLLIAALATAGIASASAADALFVDDQTVRQAQKTLNDRGFKAGPANGILHEATRAALRAFQKSENIAVTGRLNPRTLAALGVPDDTAAAGATRPAGLSSATIRQVQQKLTSRGYPAGTPDGVMGRRTRSALMDFQRAEKLPVTGRPDQRTLQALGVRT